MNKETLAKLTSCLVALDRQLTGNTEQRALQMVSQLEDPYQYIWGAEYYLSDGGYSRVYLDMSRGRVLLTSNSLAKPKENWETPAVQNIVFELRRLFVQIINENE